MVNKKILALVFLACLVGFVSLQGCKTDPVFLTVTYNGNGADFGQDPKDYNVYEEGQYVTIKDKGTLLKDNSTFLGWNTAADGSGTTYQANETYLLERLDVTFYAKWSGQGTDTDVLTPEGKLTGGPKIDQFFWGSWVRMDGVNAQWYISSDGVSVQGSDWKPVVSPSTVAFTFNDEVISKQTDNLLKVTPSDTESLEYFLFRKSGANSNAKLAIVSNTPGVSAVMRGASGLGSIKVLLKNKRNKGDVKQLNSDANGNISVTEITAEDTYDVVVPQQTGVKTEVTALVSPSFSGQDLGFVTIGDTSQNFKVSYKISSTSYYLYSGKQYSISIKIKNIGTSDMSMADYAITQPNGLILTGELNNILGTVRASGGEKEVNLLVSAPYFVEEEKSFDIPIQITGADGTIWLDKINLQFYRESITIFVKSASNGVQGIVISPDRRSFPFATISNAGSITVPFRSSPYILALSGAGYNTETKYALTTGETPLSNGSELTTATLNEPNNNENQTTSLYAAQTILGYLGVKDLDFFSVYSTSIDNTIPVSSISLTVDGSPVSADSSIDIDGSKSKTFVANISPTTANNKSLVWTSSNESIASVTSSGLVRGVSVGVATITVSSPSSGRSATVRVNIKAVTETVLVTKLNESSETNSVRMLKGGTLALSATISPVHALSKTVSWSSSNSMTATVDANGLVTGINNGSVTITATTAGGVKDTCSITVVSTELRSIYLSSGTLSPTFSATTLDYTVRVANSVSSITISGTRDDSNSTITNPMSSALISIGSNVFSIDISVYDGAILVGTKTYTVTVNRDSTDATLSALNISAGTLLPAFTSAGTTYSLSVDNSVTSLTLSPVATNAFATVNPVTVNNLLVNSTQNINMTVTAQSGAVKTYSIAITRRAAGYYIVGVPGPSGIGKVFYISNGGLNGLEAAPKLWNGGEAPPKSIWSNVSSTAIGATAQGTAIGTGSSNTTAILAQVGHVSSAAKLCKDYRGGGYADWFLPSSMELYQLYTVIGTIDFYPGNYWASTEYSASQAYDRVVDISYGSSYIINKNDSTSCFVWPVRAF